MNVPIEQFGKDHWSTLLYIEACCVDARGKLDPRKMRTHQYGADKHYFTFLKGGKQHDDERHDDWACMDDMLAAGILEEPEWGEFHGPHTSYVEVKLTDYGWRLVGLLRRRRAEGLRDADFDAPPPTVTETEQLKDLLMSIDELAAAGLGEWVGVSSDYVPEHLTDFADIRDAIAEVLGAKS